MRAKATSPLPWLGGLLAVYLIAPLIAFLVRLHHGAAGTPGLGGALVTSLVTASIATAVIAVGGVPLAYLLARGRGRLAGLLTVLVALPLALPPLMSGILLLYLVGPYTLLGRLFGGQLTDTRTGIVIAQIFVSAPFLIVAARGAFAGVDPVLEDVARTLGHGRVARFWYVALPAARSGVQAGLLLAWLRAFGEFGATVILAYHPYSLPVFTFVQFDSAGLAGTILPVAAALVAAILVLIAAQLHARPRRRAATLRAPRAPAASAGEPLSFSLHQRLAGFHLDIDVPATAPRIALLGPSGAGKTMTLRALAGIANPDHAEIRLGPEDLCALPAERRRIGYLPQQSALLPRRTVWQQVNFAARADAALAAWWLQRLGLSGLEDRFPDELSGGEQRRVALARALAADPSLVLLDEPFSALDAPLRGRLSRELRRLQREAGLRTVLVTHDPQEAALLADEVVVIAAGRVLQQGAVADVFARPASPAVAGLVGMANVHAAEVARPGLIHTSGHELAAPTAALSAGTEVLWSVAPEDIDLDGDGPLRATVTDVIDTGRGVEVALRLGEHLELTARVRRAPAWRPGEVCALKLPERAIQVWEPVAQPAS